MKTRLLLIVGCIFILTQASPGQQPITVRVLDGSTPVLNAKVAVILKSGAYQMATLTGDTYNCQPSGQCARIFAGAQGYEAATLKVGNTASGVLTVNLKPNTTKNSTVLERIGPLPGIEGHVNPHLDQHKRLYMHTKGIALLDGSRPAKQPMDFTLKRPIDAETGDGKKFKMWVVDITPQLSLLEYTMPQ